MEKNRWRELAKDLIMIVVLTLGSALLYAALRQAIH
jgi:hypothetical protein